jgi:two-component system osmolarity sensor histidine kinase EnvZ
MFAWLKETLPNRLYARAALILVAPVIVLQLVITVVFLQRHFEDVTRQLTQGIVLETQLIQMSLAENPGMSDAVLSRIAARLEMQAVLAPASLQPTQRPFYDISGIAVIDTFQSELTGFRAVDLATNPQVQPLVWTPKRVRWS